MFKRFFFFFKGKFHPKMISQNDECIRFSLLLSNLQKNASKNIDFWWSYGRLKFYIILGRRQRIIGTKLSVTSFGQKANFDVFWWAIYTIKTVHRCKKWHNHAILLYIFQNKNECWIQKSWSYCPKFNHSSGMAS